MLVATLFLVNLIAVFSYGQFNSTSLGFQELLRNKRNLCDALAYSRANDLYSCKNKKRIIFVTPLLPNPRMYEGPNREVYHVIESLVALGHDVRIVTCQKSIPTSHDPIADHLMKLGVQISRYRPRTDVSDESLKSLRAELNRYSANLFLVWFNSESHDQLKSTAVLARKLSSSLKIVTFMNDASLTTRNYQDADENEIIRASNMVITNVLSRQRYAQYLI